MADNQRYLADEMINWAEDQVAPTLSEISDFALTLDAPKLCDTAKRLLALRILAYSIKLSTIRKAEILGVTDRRIQQIEHDPKYQAACVDNIKRNFGKYASDVWRAFLRNAMTGDSQNQILFLREIGILSKVEKGEGNTLNVNINTEEIQKTRIRNQRLGLEQFGIAVPALEDIKLGEKDGEPDDS